MLRKNKKLPQRVIGDLLGLQKSTVSLWEMNKTEPNDIYKIILAKYYNVSVDYLVGLIDEEVCYYTESKFLKYPDNMTDEEQTLINEFINYIYNRRKM